MQTKSIQLPNPAQNPDIHPLPSTGQAAALHSQGRFQELFQLARKVLATDPRNVEFLDYAAICASTYGLPDQAELFWKRALAIRPDDAKTHKNLGNLLIDLKRFDEAEARLRQALAIRPDDAEAHFKLGVLLKELDRFDEAAASYRKALALKPDAAVAHYHLGTVLKALQRLTEAANSYRRALAIRPDFAEAHNHLGNLLKDLGRFDEAQGHLRVALAIRPDYAEAHNNLGNLFKEIGQYDEAQASLRKALVLKPDFAEAHNHLGSLLHDLQRFDEAEGSVRRALAIRPDYAEAHNTLGNLLITLKRFDEALASYQRAQALKPDYASAHWNESLSRLTIGDFVRGWQKHEWRWRNKALAMKPRAFEQPLWLGEEALEGKTILLHAEQGYGDTLQFCRYAESVAERGARVLLEVPPPLKSLLASLEGVSQLLAAGETLPRFDLHCPLLSLPLACRTELSTLPAKVPYLRADPARVADWSAKLGAKNRPRIGLAWSGSTIHKNDRNRSIPLQRLLPLLSADFQWVCLQKELRTDDQAVLYQHPEIISFADQLHDFADTAALVESMDLVISVDTAIAHLAGALARPLWLLLPFIPDWRWLLEREDSPWYPTARLFRQSEDRTWDTLVERVKNQLIQYFGKPIPSLQYAAICAHKPGMPARTESFWKQALAIRPDDARAHKNLGDLLIDRKRFDEAETRLRKALSLCPDDAEAHFKLGNLYQQIERFDQAADCYRRALVMQPDSAVTHYNLGIVLKTIDRLDEAENSYRRALAIQPDLAEAHNNLGNLFKEIGRYDEAQACLHKALALKPGYAEAHNNLGSLQHALKRFDEAEASIRHALAIQPDLAEAHNNLGNLLITLKRFEEALASYHRAQTLKPDYAGAHWNESLGRLTIGDFARGWQKYEWRWHNKCLDKKQKNFKQPLWLGAQSLAGKTILLHAEQGFGDTLQFCRYARSVAELGANVVLEAQPALKSLLASLDGVSQVLAAGETPPRFDYHCPLPSLPLAFKTELSTIPAEVPYLRADPSRAADWANRLGGKSRPRIGLAWAGNATHQNDGNRSIPLQQLLPLLSADCQWVCLQKELRPGDQALLDQHPEILGFTGELHDFAETAALLESLDLVISVDTAIAHLAGALARPLWLLLPFIPDWRWLLERVDSPWYPTARLFRQSEKRDWDAVIERVGNELKPFRSNTL